jgi:drug/metabolite transporter (DMT)-like permease
MNDKTIGVALAIASAFLIGSNFVISKYLLGFVHFTSYLVYWFGTASLIMLPILLFNRDFQFLKKLRTDARFFAVIAAFSILNSLLFFGSLSLLGSAFFAFVMKIATVVSILMGVILLKERFTVPELFGAALALIGAVVLTFAPGEITLSIIIGVVTAITIGVQDFFWKFFSRSIRPLTLNFYRTFSVSAVLLLFLSLTSGVEPLPLDRLPLLLIGVVLSPVLGMFALITAMKKLEVSKVVALRTIEPFAVVAYGLLFFNAVPTARELLGGTMLVVGVAILALFHHVAKHINGLREKLFIK